MYLKSLAMRSFDESEKNGFGYVHSIELTQLDRVVDVYILFVKSSIMHALSLLLGFICAVIETWLNEGHLTV